ncbi:hypothetical protein GALMADRAFT_238624 [Galerina marginata CBS 339.88]|uniref:F-box domain-containing protein n=1 Tax=Galerina marginata (strain CBS 339.88) TaxID=685588 RepID=A0A067TVF1_GALM3|nr:hypothetical protein GALMADRAFT_238624 [Galerina marginata CBS 339.88]
MRFIGTNRQPKGGQPHTAPITILSLPPELIEAILSSCTNADHLALSRTCTSLNTVALHIFFARNNVSNPVKGVLSSYEEPREMLEVVRVALFAKQLSSVTWEFNPGTECSICKPHEVLGWCWICNSHRGRSDLRILMLRRAVDEINSLRAIFSRLSGVGFVDLDSRKVDAWLDYDGLEDLYGYALDKHLWRKAFVGLLNAVLDSGCRTLEIKNGESFKKYYENEVSKKQPQEGEVPLARTNWRGLKLQSLRVHSDMFLPSPFYEWTASLLTSPACADTLTSLSFQPKTMSIPPLLLASLKLPNLVEFEIAARARPPRKGYASFEDVSAFLARHNSLSRKVNLYGVGLPPTDEAILGSPSTTTSQGGFHSQKRHMLPHLKSVTAHPAYIIWLLGLAVSSPPSSKLWSGNPALGNLQSVGITAEDYEEETNFDYASFDKALETLAKFCTWRNSERAASKFKPFRTKEVKERTIDLLLEFKSEEGIGPWFASHLSASREPPVISRLAYISTLTIATPSSAKLPAETLNILPEWLALVSNASIGTSGLQRVNLLLDHSPKSFPGGEDVFIRRVAKKCIGLRWLQMDSKAEMAVDLDKFRRFGVGGREVK